MNFNYIEAIERLKKLIPETDNSIIDWGISRYAKIFMHFMINYD